MVSALDQVAKELFLKPAQPYLEGFEPCHFPILLDGAPDHEGNYQETTIKLDVNDSNLDDFCSQHRLTPCSVLQTAWAVVVSCYAGVGDISFAYSANVGDLPDLGLDDWLICRAKIAADKCLIETMADIMRDFGAAWMDRKYSISEIQKLLDLEGQPLFNSGLLVNHPSASEVQQGACNKDAVKVTNPIMHVCDFQKEPVTDLLNQCDIVARISLEDDGILTVCVRTRPSMFSAAQTADVAHTVRKTLSAITRAPPRSAIEDLNYLSQRDCEKLMSWNGSIPSSIDSTFHRHFEDVVRRAPEAPAICSWDYNFTYRELDILSSRLASNLQHLGVAPEVFVLICFNKSSFAYVSMLSIFKAGGAFVAIDPSYPSSRIRNIVKTTKAFIVVAEPAHCHLFDGIIEHVIALDSDLAVNFQLMPQVVGPQPRPWNAAYAVFTSGSTGAPKGIIVEHRNLCTAAFSLASPMRIKSTSRVLQFAAFTFDLSYGDIFVTLSQGGCICVPSEHERINNLAGAITRMDVNTACLIPSVARMFKPEDVPCLETLLLGGEALVQENLELWAANVALGTLYGPSECTVWCTAQTGVTVDSPANSIGRGVGALVWIVSATNHDRLCPIGCIGELLIEGPVVARGYFDANQTKDCFIDNPRWAEVESGQRRRFYKTGDLARYRSDGYVSFIGRKDTQIKLRGRRIEMGEIEYHLSCHDLLSQSVVTLPAAGIYRRKLVALLVLKTGKASASGAPDLKLVSGVTKKTSTVAVAKIKEHLSARIPLYMLPQHWIVVQDIPLLVSGKMNRVLAKKFIESFTNTADSFEETTESVDEIGAKLGKTDESVERIRNKASTSQNVRDLTESRLQKLWSLVLDRDIAEIALNQDFVSLGGDSFAAMDLVARCRAEGHTFTVSDVLDSSTISRMASRVKALHPMTCTLGHERQDVLRLPDSPSAHPPWACIPVWWDARQTLTNPITT